MDFAVPADQSANQRKRKERQVLRPCLWTKKPEEDEGDGDTNCSWYTGNSPSKAF